MTYKAGKLIRNYFCTVNKGFTLAEILIAACLFTFLIGLVVSTMSFFRKNFSNVNSREWQIHQAEAFLLKANNEFRDARFIEKPEIWKYGKVLNFTTLENEDVSYILSENGTLTRKSKGGKNTKTILESVSSLKFTRETANTVGVELILGAKSQKKYNLITTFYSWNIRP